MQVTPRSKQDAERISRRTLLREGIHPGTIKEATEKPSKAGADMIELLIGIPDPNGDEREIRDWLLDNKVGAAKLRHAAEAVGALAEYEAGEISPVLFVGQLVRVKISIEKRRGFPDQNRVIDYLPADAGGVVRLRAG